MSSSENRNSTAKSSDAKTESNRRNARKSTGPRTEAGKNHSRLNALRHGILASHSVITMIEGREPRREFEELVAGLAEDFQPVGTFEQTLVQDIAACFWRKRRLLRFENRAAFESRDSRTHAEMRNERYTYQDPPPRYLLEDQPVEADEILKRAGLGLDLPNERDCMRVVRYEGSILQALKAALAQLQARQKERLANRDGANPSAYPDREVVIDTDAMKVNAGPEHRKLNAITSLFSHGLDRRREEEEAEADEREAEAEERAAEAAAATQTSENNQTKPKNPANPGPESASHAQEDGREGAKSSSLAGVEPPNQPASTSK
jgi:hypothetical protein